MKKIYTLAFALLFSAGLCAQNVTKKAVFTTGGSYGAPGNHVKIYTYDVDDSSTIVIDSIPGDFSNHVVSDGRFAYVHVGRGFGHPNGGDRIFKYDLLNVAGAPIDSTAEIVGIQHFEIGRSKLVVTRGFPVTSEFFLVIDKNDLQNVLYTDTEAQSGCNGIAIHEDVAYIASTNLNDTGVIHVMQLEPTEMYSGKILLDSLSAGAAKLFFDNQQLILSHQRYTPNYDIWYAGVTTIQLGDSSFVSDTANFTQCNGFDYFSGNLMGDFGNGIETYQISTGTRFPFLMTWATAAKKDPNAERFYVQTTDYFSYGQVEVYDEIGVGMDTTFSDVGGSALDMVTNNFPVAVNDTIWDVLQSPITIEVLANDYDIDDDDLKILQIFQQPLSGTAILVGQNIKYDVVDSNFFGVDSIGYVISDNWEDMDTGYVLIDFSTGITKPNLSSDVISVHPNPTTDFVQLSGNEIGNGEVRIVSSSGTIVRQFLMMNAMEKVDVSQLSPGIYFVIFQSDTHAETHRLMKL